MKINDNNLRQKINDNLRKKINDNLRKKTFKMI